MISTLCPNGREARMGALVLADERTFTAPDAGVRVHSAATGDETGASVAEIVGVARTVSPVQVPLVVQHTVKGSRGANLLYVISRR